MKLFSDAAWIAAGQIVSLIGGIACLKLFSSSLGPREYGGLAMAIAGVNFCHQLTFGPLAVTTGKHAVLANARGDRDNFMRASRRLTAQVAYGIASIALLGGCVLWLIGESRSGQLFVAAGAVAAISGVGLVRLALLNAAGLRRLMAVQQATEIVCRFALGSALFMIFASVAPAALLAFALGAGIAVVSFRGAVDNAGLHVPVDGTPSKDPWARSMIDYALPFLLWGLATSAHQASDRWFLLSHRGAEAACKGRTKFRPLGGPKLGQWGGVAAAA